MTLDSAIADGTVFLASAGGLKVHIVSTRGYRIAGRNTRYAGWSLCSKLNAANSHRKVDRAAFNESACGLCAEQFAVWKAAA